MNKTLLINRINAQDYTKIKKKIFFLIGNINLPIIEDKLVKSINESTLIDDKNDIVFKYNGIELNICTQKIPAITKLLTNAGISIYSIFETYNPDL